MDTQVILRQLLRAPASYRTLFQTSPRPPLSSGAFTLQTTTSQQQQRYLTLPRIITPSFWTSLIPKPLRRNPISQDPSPEIVAAAAPRQRTRNPATPFIILSILVGSQAIQTLWLKRDRERYMRRAEAKMGVLKEVIERVQAGETVDVESVLRTGDAVSEKEWREVLGDIAREEALFRSKKGRRAERAAQKEDSAIAPSQEQDVGREGHVDEGNAKVESLNGARFY